MSKPARPGDLITLLCRECRCPLPFRVKGGPADVNCFLCETSMRIEVSFDGARWLLKVPPEGETEPSVVRD